MRETDSLRRMAILALSRKVLGLSAKGKALGEGHSPRAYREMVASMNPFLRPNCTSFHLSAMASPAKTASSDAV